MQNQNDERSIFDWLIWTLIHLVIIVAIGYAGIQVYGPRLGLWVAASATVAGFASCYLFAKDVPGETLMKCWLYLCVAANAGYLVHNGARNLGIQGYNAAQVEKYEKGMAEAGKATSRRIARELRLGAKEASTLEVAFSDGVSVIVAILAFLELGSALMIFAISSRRLKKQREDARPAKRTYEELELELSQALARIGREPYVDTAGKPRRQSGEFDKLDEIEVSPTTRLEGKDSRR